MGVEVLRRYQKVWGDRVDVDYIPFFLGGIMAGSKNRPPISVPGKSLSRLLTVILTISQGEVYAKGSSSIHEIIRYA